MTKELLGSLELNRIYQMDCLEGSKLIENGSVDLILTDLPYGNMNTDGGRKLGISGWDHAIDPFKVFEVANRILRKNGKMVLFSQEPYTTRLINEAIANVPFSYRMIWEKDSFANALGCKKAPVSYYEDVLVFSKIYDTERNHPLYDYADKVYAFINKPKRDIFKEMGHQGAFHFLLGKGSFQFHLCTEKTYAEMTALYTLDKMEGYESYSDLKIKEKEFYSAVESTFNIWDGTKHKSNVLKYKKDYDGFHPTQKPVLLLEDLIKTFSNENNLVVDLTCGSGSTCVAAARTNRNFIGFELESNYVQIANQRLESISDTEAERKLTE